MNKAFDIKNNLNVTVISVSGGWTTVLDHKGNQYKLRNSQVGVAKHATPIKEAVKHAPIVAKEKTTPVATDESKLRTCGTTKYDPADYVKVKSSNGNTSMDKGDALAIKLRQFDLDGIYKYAAVELGVPEKELRTRYAHLNPGQQRMCLGNRLRAI